MARRFLQMVVTGLLANLSLMLAQATSFPSPYKYCPVGSSPDNSACLNELRPIPTGLPFEGDDENRWLMACLVFSIISFFCGMVQLLLGAVCGIFTVGRSPQVREGGWAAGCRRTCRTTAHSEQYRDAARC